MSKLRADTSAVVNLIENSRDVDFIAWAEGLIYPKLKEILDQHRKQMEYDADMKKEKWPRR